MHQYDHAYQQLLTRSMHIPKLPFVSYSRILALSAAVSHTFMRPSYVVLARYCPSSDRAMAHSSPALFPSNGPPRCQLVKNPHAAAPFPHRYNQKDIRIAPTIRPSSFQPASSLKLQIFASPPNPTLAAFRPLRLATR
jgi:hypothetical protein